ncbi:MAG: DUF3574 domain-containing protein [Firmicutes bacterium]|nr:DUF3574 domain-containing protein [Bacillota bacterium]MBQ2042910.1 DUF3574 domain-containing protein [Bacillota bacterium]MBQ5414731.1 DUF3574 domain-containing protein [Bacillota bacterium]
MTETKIYVGLNDSETRVQMYDTEKYISILKDVCRNYHVGFSVSAGQGGYFFEDGSYVQETTLVLSLIDADVDTVNEIAKDLCVFFRQESVLITENKVRSYFIKEKL